MTSLVADPPSREQLAEHLVRTRIAGEVATTRASNIGNIRRMLDREPAYWFGVELGRPWSLDEVVAVLAETVGMDPDAAREHGTDRIDVDRCIAALDAAAERIGALAAHGGTVMFATGHPTGLLALYLPLAVALAAAGCQVVTPGAEQWVSVFGESRRIRYVGGVATVGTGGDLLHTHSPEPMQQILRWGTARPDLLVADHGWAGAAAQAGWDVVGFADTNDPALFVAAAEGRLDVVVPLDDNVDPAAYVLLAAHLARDIPR
jgi:hypothetical protein